MVVDTSALVAIMLLEEDAREFATRISRASTCLLSAASYVESSIVLEAREGAGAGNDLDEVLKIYSVEIVPVDAEQARLARSAFQRFGKGRHPARLNFGDCFSYALAKASGEPLLFKGGDFAKTDIEAA